MAPVSSYLRVDADLASDPLDTTPSWTDYTQHFQSCRISRGRAGVFDLYKVGTLELVARNGRNGVGEAPWLDPGDWHRWRQIRVVYTGGVSDVPLFTGYITTTEHSLNQPLNVNLVTVKAVDKLGILRQEQVDQFTTDPTSALWKQNGLRYPSVDAFVDASTNFTGATIDLYGGSTAPIHFVATEDVDPSEPANKRRKTKRRGVKGNFWQLLQDGLEVEYGTFHIDAAGGFAFNGRYSTLLAIADQNYLVLTDTPSVATDLQIKYGTLQVAPPGSDYADAAYATGTSDIQKSTVVTPTGYPETSYTRSKLPCPNDNWVQANTEMWAEIFSDTGTWVSKATVVLNPRMDGQALAVATNKLGRILGDISHTPAGTSQRFYFGLIEGVDHSIQANPPIWEATLSFSNAGRWQDPYGSFDDYGILGDTWTLGTSRLAP